MPPFRRIAFHLPEPGTEGLIGAALRRNAVESTAFEGIPEARTPVHASLQDRVALINVGALDDPDAWEDLENRVRLSPGVTRAGPVVRRGRRWVSFLSRRFVVKFSSRATVRPDDIVTDPRWTTAGVHLVRRLPYLRDGFLFRIDHPRPVPVAGARPLPRVIEICRGIMHAFGGDVDFAEPDLVTGLDLAFTDPTDSEFENQWNLHDINVEAAWREIDGAVGVGLQYGDPAVRIAVLDMQIDTTHPEFQAPLSDGRPRIELPAFDFSDGSFIDVDNVAATAHEHGTGTAGIVGSAAGDHAIVGVAPNCQVLAVTLGTQTTVDLLNAMYWAAGFDPTTRGTRDLAYPPPPEPGADVLLCSWQKPILDTSDTALPEIAGLGRKGKGSVIVFGAGEPLEQGDPETFAGLPDVITVAAYTTTGAQTRVRDASSRLQVADVAAPTGVKTCAPGSAYDDLGGTSAAAPHVAGVIALMLSANPGLTFDQVRDIVRFSVLRDRWESLTGESFEEAFGQGVIDAQQAVVNALKLRPSLEATLVGFESGNLIAGRSLEVGVSVRNVGLTEAPATTVRAEIRNEQTGEVLGSHEDPVPALAVETSHEIRHSVTPTREGVYVVELQTDAHGDIRGGGPGEIIRERFEVTA